MYFLAVRQAFVRHDRESAGVALDSLKYHLVGRHALFGENYFKTGTDDIDGALDEFAESLQSFVFGQDFLLRIRQNSEIEALFIAVIVVGLDRGRIDGQNFGSGFFEFPPVRLKGG